MTASALALVLASAVAHATWNLLAKRAGGGLVFAWLFHVAGVVACAPFAVALLVVQRPSVGTVELVAMFVSAVLHLAYFLFLAQAYRGGDLSLVYPLARGTGPLLATIVAVLVFGERPTPVALAGATLIGVGVLILTGDPRRLLLPGASRSVAYALLTGLFIAAYTLWDKLSVGQIGVPPLLYFWGFTAGTALLLVPSVLRRLDEVRDTWSRSGREVLGVGVLVPVAYVLVLTALAVSPVSYVAPAREIGILFGALMGARLLSEGDVRRRLCGAAAMVVGVAGLAMG
ncbi:MAG: EamA family transporter [Chloroflexota bacterium]